MAAADTWTPAHTANLSWNAAAEPCVSLEYQHQVDTFETTNTVSNGDHEFGVGGRTRSVRWSRPTKTGETAIPAEEDLVDCVYSDAYHTYTGKARITSASRKGGGKGGYMIDYQATFTGAVAKAAVT